MTLIETWKACADLLEPLTEDERARTIRALAAVWGYDVILTRTAESERDGIK